MKAVLIGEGAGASRDEIMAGYPRHEVVVDAYKARGQIVGIGPFVDGGNRGIFSLVLRLGAPRITATPLRPEP